MTGTEKRMFVIWCMDCGSSMVRDEKYPNSLYCERCKLKADVVFTSVKPRKKCKVCGNVFKLEESEKHD